MNSFDIKRTLHHQSQKQSWFISWQKLPNQTTSKYLTGGKKNTYLIQPSIRVNCLCVRFILDAIQVFMEPVQQESHELLGIMLGITCKLTGFTGHDCLWSYKWENNRRRNEDTDHAVFHTFNDNKFLLKEKSVLQFWSMESRFYSSQVKHFSVAKENEKDLFHPLHLMHTLSFEGWKAWCVPFQRALSSTANPMANLPPVPSGLLQLISASNARSAGAQKIHKLVFRH